MQFSKDMIVSMIEQRAGSGQAQQAAQQLPDQVDHEEHAGLLSQFGLDPQELLGQSGGGGGGGGYQDPGQGGGGYQDPGQGGGGYQDPGQGGGYQDSGQGQEYGGGSGGYQDPGQGDQPGGYQ